MAFVVEKMSEACSKSVVERFEDYVPEPVRNGV
jgi:hypothetical protein